MARYRLTPLARSDLLAIGRDIAADSSPERAAAMVKRIRDRCRLIEVTPTQGRVRDDGPIADEEVRSVPEWPYIIYYRIAPGNVPQVLRFIDGRRDLGTAFLEE